MQTEQYSKRQPIWKWFQNHCVGLRVYKKTILFQYFALGVAFYPVHAIIIKCWEKNENLPQTLCIFWWINKLTGGCLVCIFLHFTFLWCNIYYQKIKNARESFQIFDFIQQNSKNTNFLSQVKMKSAKIST